MKKQIILIIFLSFFSNSQKLICKEVDSETWSQKKVRVFDKGEIRTKEDVMFLLGFRGFPNFGQRVKIVFEHIDYLEELLLTEKMIWERRLFILNFLRVAFKKNVITKENYLRKAIGLVNKFSTGEVRHAGRYKLFNQQIAFISNFSYYKHNPKITQECLDDTFLFLDLMLEYNVIKNDELYALLKEKIHKIKENITSGKKNLAKEELHLMKKEIISYGEEGVTKPGLDLLLKRISYLRKRVEKGIPSNP
ncbi:hypothetical protein ACFL35_19340 [Candidatus Riflebacteria bacterium]